MDESSIRHLRALGPSLAGYVRPGSRDNAIIARLIGQGLPVGAGIVFDSANPARSADLRSAASEAELECVLDPRSVELSTVGGFDRSSIASLPWAGSAPHQPSDLAGSDRTQFVQRVATAAVETGASAVLAPTHFLDGLSPWLAVDVVLASILRDALDQLGAKSVAIYYPLVTTLQVARSSGLGTRIRRSLKDLAEEGVIDAIWLRIHPFGTTSAGPLSLTRYVDFARSLHPVGVPLVGDRTGTVGLALLGFNAVGGIESSVTFGDRYDHGALKKPSTGSGFVPPPRVYLQEVGAMVDRSVAEGLYERRGIKGRHQCGIGCCPRGIADTLGDPRRHFLVNRASEISRLSAVPEGARPEHYLSNWLRPASDRMIQVVKAAPNLAGHRVRLDNWRMTLTKLLDEGAPTASVALAPTGRRLRRTA